MADERNGTQPAMHHLNTHGTEQYTGEQIQVLEGLEAVRRRPGMYIGDTSQRGLHHLIWEIIDNAVDERLAGFCDKILVTLHSDGSRVGAGQRPRHPRGHRHPRRASPPWRSSTPCCTPAASSAHGAYKVSGGLHGVGVAVVNALSKWLYRPGPAATAASTRQSSSAGGKALTGCAHVGDTRQARHRSCASGRTPRSSNGRVRLRMPSSSGFSDLAFLNQGLFIRFIDERGATRKATSSSTTEGLTDLRAVPEPVPGAAARQADLYLQGRATSAVRWRWPCSTTTRYSETIVSFANNIRTVEGGTHLTGLQDRPDRTINNYAQKQQAAEGARTDNLPGEDFREGMTAILSVKMPEPQFEGQTKTKLGNSEVRRSSPRR